MTIQRMIFRQLWRQFNGHLICDDMQIAVPSPHKRFDITYIYGKYGNTVEYM